MNFTPLTNAELTVMDLLWDHGELTARQIREALYPDAVRAQHGTVQRFLQSLEEKGYVLRDKSLPVHLFSASMTREEYAARQIESLAERLTGGSIAPLLTHLISNKRINKSEISRLRALLDSPNSETRSDATSRDGKRRGGKRRG
ncbi:MAG: BlaI/MecI/CopY family transcriptional regulator [Planctomycetes bacterium]|nr:BlaI/MecI/CopY family transcriptional regulator [Planctomycetota bacterium]MCB9920160.1 BlaI/MecI/CopY family transcriptional regulator [Planctomycetota bacterium]